MTTRQQLATVCSQMRIITPRRLREFWGIHPQAEKPLRGWMRVARRARWRSLADVRRDFPHADVTDDTRSGRTVTIFNIGGNKYRLATAIDYPLQVVNVLQVMTHVEYDKEKWKRTL